MYIQKQPLAILIGLMVYPTLSLLKMVGKRYILRQYKIKKSSSQTLMAFLFISLKLIYVYIIPFLEYVHTTRSIPPDDDTLITTFNSFRGMTPRPAGPAAATGRVVLHHSVILFILRYIIIILYYIAIPLYYIDEILWPKSRTVSSKNISHAAGLLSWSSSSSVFHPTAPTTIKKVVVGSMSHRPYIY